MEDLAQPAPVAGDGESGSRAASPFSRHVLGRLPDRWVRRLRRVYRRIAFPRGYFRGVALDDREIETGAYESYLYGSREAWRGHGAFQVFFLRTMGVRPAHTLLDVGCGPLRGGIHVIAHLDRGRYCGVDFNESFIRAARHRVRAAGLSAKEPVLRVIGDLALDSVERRFDFVLAFSVLNHCNREQRRRFFALVPDRLEDQGRLYVTHADWFEARDLTGTPLVLTRTFSKPAEIRPALRMTDWAWPEERAPLFPILELRRAGD